MFLSGLVYSFKIIFYLNFTEKQFLLERFTSFCDLKQPSSKIMLQSYLPWNCSWYNYFKLRNIVNLMRNGFGSTILDVFSCD